MLDNGSDDECPICFEPMQNARWSTPCCDHSIHECCYIKCVKDRPSCPMCRAITIVVREVSTVMVTRKYNTLKSSVVFVTGMMIISIVYNLLCFTNSSKGNE